jgi:aspartate oxidase
LLCLVDARRVEPILNLYGAGEVTAGVHGGNRLGGNSLLECVVCDDVLVALSVRRLLVWHTPHCISMAQVFGRIAGEHAAKVPEKK